MYLDHLPSGHPSVQGKGGGREAFTHPAHTHHGKMRDSLLEKCSEAELLLGSLKRSDDCIWQVLFEPAAC